MYYFECIWSFTLVLKVRAIKRRSCIKRNVTAPSFLLSYGRFLPLQVTSLTNFCLSFLYFFCTQWGDTYTFLYTPSLLRETWHSTDTLLDFSFFHLSTYQRNLYDCVALPQFFTVAWYWYSVLWMCQSLFNHSSMYGHLVSFKYFASTNTATMNNLCMFIFILLKMRLQCTFLEVILLDQNVSIFIVWLNIAKFLSPRVVLVCISTQRCTEGVILHSHTHRMYRQTFSWVPIIISRCLCCIILHLSNCD